MKKLTRRSFTAAGILAALGLTGAGLKGCNPFKPSDYEVVDVYGPPEDFEEYDPGGDANETVYGPPDWYDEFDSSDNMVPAVYGPPEWFEDEAAESQAE